MLNFAGAFVSVAVAATIATGIVDQEAITLDIVLAGLVGAITWNLITWFVGLPSSSSHALIGGMIGSAIAAEGIDVVQWQGILDKVLIPSLIAPILGIAIAFCSSSAITWLIARRSPEKVNRVFRRAQLVSGGVRRLHARDERRAEDDGHHRARPRRVRPSRPRTSTGRRPG